MVELPNMNSLTICFAEDILGNASILVFDLGEEAFSPLFNLEGRVRESLIEVLIHFPMTSLVTWYSGSMNCLNECECEITQSCPTLCDPMVCSLPGSSTHGIFKARILEWVAISFPFSSVQFSRSVMSDSATP